ncbi:hypothetical protein [Alkalicoccus luteus]|uniref:Uncharacterized protein n=1 Tax=Alkalicoccus luteus TaxID=1237094 RepID=A0A969PR82_9BACI|nr:hypothetical protein [Alkalicoccus luteus]NJP38070.1 hypothetical protein [Alkalicoccus luteus]
MTRAFLLLLIVLFGSYLLFQYAFGLRLETNPLNYFIPVLLVVLFLLQRRPS